ncbi:MAG: HD domain-containing protein [Deltaproteobacteria bacterium]|uniref:HD domain-containing phosphohydrolase n=1 Tax=Desulfobacula sp. TaxID=2593537 RepID=UPI0019BC1F7F|nr:HD domain-containing protein [Candidatus Desulfobacula maris]MBL6993199.1 HD domain-containing protein [Desulfobacula sp.]
MKSTGFEEILSGFSKISPLKFEIWNEKGAVGACDPGDLKGVRQFLPGIAARVYEAEDFRHEETETQDGLFGLPLFDDDIIAGVLLAYFSNAHDNAQVSCPDPEDAKTLLTRIAGMIEERWDMQKESDTLINELDKSYESLHLYSNVATQIKTLNFSSQMILHLLNEIKENIRMDMVFSIMPDRPDYSEIVCKEEVKIKDEKGFVASLIKAVEKSDKALEEGYFIVNNSTDEKLFSKIHKDPFRFLAVKIMHNESFYGWLGIFSFSMDDIIKRSELRLLVSIAEQIGVVIANTDLYHNLEDFGINIVKSLIVTIEAKDVYTGGHSERVHHVSMLIAQEAGISEEDRKVLNWSALLHDVGKIGIPEAILNKPARLSDKEYSIIKGHPLKGAEIISPLDYLAGSIPGVLHHHEAYDGTGYPSRIKGQEIPLFSRIISVADTFDAITSDRAYRKGASFEKGRKIINEVSGTQLDPEMVAVFNKVYKRARTWLAEGQIK